MKTIDYILKYQQENIQEILEIYLELASLTKEPEDIFNAINILNGMAKLESK